MNLAVISVLLQELLLENERITLPGVGTFSLEEVPASFLEESNIMLPPTKKIVFDNLQNKNDGLLENAYARKTGLILEDSKRDLLFLSKKVKEAIANNLKVVIPGFGTLFNNNGEISFDKDKDLDVSPDSFGLEAITVEPIEVPVEVKPETKVEEKDGGVDFDLTQFDIKPMGQSKEEGAEAADKEAVEVVPMVEVVPEVEVAPAPEAEPAVEKIEKKGDGQASTIVMKILVAAVVIMLVILLFVIFKEQIAQLLKHVLYSKEELELMEKWATL